MDLTKTKKDFWRELIDMSDCEEMKNNIKYINDTFKKLGLTPVQPVINNSISILVKNDRPVNVIRLTRPQLVAIEKHLAWIKMNEISWSYTLEAEQKSLWFSRFFVTLEELFGPNDEQGTDDGYKSSFYFPFLLEFPQEKENLGYLMIVRDLKCSVYYKFAKILPSDKYADKNKIPNTFKDFTEDDIKETVRSFYKYLESYFERFINHSFDSFFYKTIECDLVVYGYKDGAFFDEGYDDPDEYEEVIKKLSSYKE